MDCTRCDHTKDQHATVGTRPYFITSVGPCNVKNEEEGTHCTCYSFTTEQDVRRALSA